MQAVRSILLAAQGGFACALLHELLRAGVAVHTVVVPPRTGHSLPVAQARTDDLAYTALSCNVPVVAAGTDLAASLDALAPDLLLVACWPEKIPQAACASAKLGSFNFHPSVLPAYRGPTPLFWQLRDGLRATGISLHAVTAAWDAGPVLAQQTIPLSDGLSGPAIEQRLARAGAQLLSAQLPLLQQGRARFQPQDERIATYQSWPRPEDFHISAHWPAQRIYNFICATQHWQQSYVIHAPAAVVTTRSALDWDLSSPTGGAILRTVDAIHLPCGAGTLRLPAAVTQIEFR